MWIPSSPSARFLKFESPFVCIVFGTNGTDLIRDVLRSRHLAFNRVPGRMTWLRTVEALKRFKQDPLKVDLLVTRSSLVNSESLTQWNEAGIDVMLFEDECDESLYWNTHYFLFGHSSVSALDRIANLFFSSSATFIKAVFDSCDHLLLDCNASTPSSLRVKTDITQRNVRTFDSSLYQ